MTAPLVSTVIPSYNYGRFVCDAVESALAQTYQPVEVIVVDDGSTDDTRQRLERFGGAIRYVHQQNKGLSAARNTGVRHAQGEWVALLDADDVWHRDKTRIQLDAIQELGNVGLVGSMPASELPSELPANPPVERVTVRDFMVSSRMGPSGALIRRSCFSEVGLFDESLTSIEDRDMWLRLASRFTCVAVLSPCWWYRPHQGQMSRSAARMRNNYEKVLTKFFAEHPEHRSLERMARGYLYSDSAWCSLSEGDTAAARELILKSFRTWPRPLGDSRLQPFLRTRILARLLLGEALFGRLSSKPRESSR